MIDKKLEKKNRTLKKRSPAANKRFGASGGVTSNNLSW